MSLSATTRGQIEIPAPSATLASASAAQKRLQSLDVLRGITIVLMILVNASGGVAHGYRPLVHAPWNGLTFADVVFPCFLFIVGISLVLSLSDRGRRGAEQPALMRKALKRAAILFVIGLILNGYPWYNLATLRIYGVLQRIALCYFVAVLLYLWLKPRTLVIVTAAILLGYYVLLRWVPVPGYGMPGVDVAFLDPHGNLPAWLDRQIFSASHLYLQGFYDPEGLLSSLPALASTLIGVLAGIELVKRKGGWLEWAFITGASCLATGLLWSHWFPLNKRLWTSSFVLVNAGISLIALGLLRWWLDGHSDRGGALTPFKIFGMNALAAYVFSDFLAASISSVRLPHSGITLGRWLFHPVPAFIPNRYFAGLVCAVLYIGVCFLPVWLLYRKRIFLKI
jgi:predicted acyltransferase